MQSPRVAPLLRQVLAALTLVAAFAFQLRAGGMVDLAQATGAVTLRGAGPVGVRFSHHSAPPVSSPLQSPQAGFPPSPRPGRDPTKEGHHHAAHCPFCVTGAFALEAGVLPLPTAPPRLAARRLASVPAHHPATVRHADARAPPASL
ncbi:hypothetical protein ACFP9V_24565 [Deinococcus radiopugnans]|uniref:DUF2946 domain-containing protein n=1 Tax=Deinococcus radiopugnans ATCC 19172 TaxID=585398 RepID=A0A5C4XXS0_9DEIO|nr:hypothetical protein [Deinococcus radiopugnans]MBB6018312.1 hypothetical protein [Deinococcus radiopugnans ATCC 19172]TNM68068.1 hypothetical protein FHR04_17185 [Deinococcus radiopugnans ATCC 19172]